MIVGVCGYGYSGSSALLSLLKEYDEAVSFSSGREFEFAISYEPDGLLDLHYNLIETPAKHLKGDSAISRFINYTNYIMRAYNRETHGQFEQLTKAYLDSIVQVSYKCRRTASHRERFAGFFEKGSKYIQIKLEKLLKKRVILLREDTRYISVKPYNFEEATRKYIKDILCSADLVKEDKMAVLDQPFPPNNPCQVFRFFEDPYAIVLDRDPRDIYITVKRLAFSSGRFIPTDNVEDFVKYFKAVSYHNVENDNNRVLRIHFEDLVYNYDQTEREIEGFLGIHKHTRRKELFNPDVSIKNTQLKDLFPEEKDNIEYIEKELKDYLYDFDKSRMVTDRNGVYEMAAW